MYNSVSYMPGEISGYSSTLKNFQGGAIPRYKTTLKNISKQKGQIQETNYHL